MNIKNKKIGNIYIFLLSFIRIKDVITWVAIALLGFILGLSSLSLTTYLIPFIVVMIISVCITSFTFVINNYYDIETDIMNPRRRDYNAIASGIISKETSRKILIILVIITYLVTFLHGKIQTLLLSTLLFILGWIYSAPPLRVKGRPGFDITLHFFGFFFFVLLGSSISGNITLISIIIGISAGIFSCIYQIINHIEDYQFDKKSETLTFAVWIGINNAKYIMNILIVIHLGLLILISILFYENNYFTYLYLLMIMIISTLLSKPKKSLNLKTIPIPIFVLYFSVLNYIYFAANHLISILNF